MTKSPENLKSSLEGLSEREVRILVQDEFIPIMKHGEQKMCPIESNIQSGSGLVSLSPSSLEQGLKVADGHQTMNNATHGFIDNQEQIMRQAKISANNGDIYNTGLFSFLLRIGENRVSARQLLPYV